MKRKLESILTIGPIYPYRGGIAQYGGLLVKNLQKKFHVYNVSFKKMYPSFLYPGKSQKDYSNNYLKFNNSKYILSTLNPLTYFQTVSYVKKVNPDLIIIHWWNPFFAIAYIPIILCLKKKYMVCVCCNNVMPHDKMPFSKILTKQILNKAHIFIIHSKDEEKVFNRLVPNKKIYFTTVCPNLNVIGEEKYTKETARKKLHIQNYEHIILFFGFVRKYKGLQYLLKAMPDVIKKVADVKLLIIGEFYEDKNEYIDLIEKNNLQENVFINEEFVPDEEVEVYFKAADVTILPYVSATTSGVIQTAYQYGCPVIASNVGGLPEAIENGKTGYLLEPRDSWNLARKIEQFFEEYENIPWKENIKLEQEKYSWDRMIDGIESLWEQI